MLNGLVTVIYNQLVRGHAFVSFEISFVLETLQTSGTVQPHFLGAALVFNIISRCCHRRRAGLDLDMGFYVSVQRLLLEESFFTGGTLRDFILCRAAVILNLQMSDIVSTGGSDQLQCDVFVDLVDALN